MIQWSVLSPLLLSWMLSPVIREVVYKLLYADDLVITANASYIEYLEGIVTAPLMEPLGSV